MLADASREFCEEVCKESAPEVELFSGFKGGGGGGKGCFSEMLADASREFCKGVCIEFCKESAPKVELFSGFKGGGGGGGGGGDNNASDWDLPSETPLA